MPPTHQPTIRPPPKTQVDATPSPHLGGNAYCDSFRSHFIWIYENGLYDPNQPHAPHVNSIKDWIRRRDSALGSALPFAPSGNSTSDVIQGEERVALAVYRTAYPEATAAEIIAFLHNMFPNNARIYIPSQITETENDLGYSRKKTSTVANQAFRPDLVLRRDLFWSSGPPTGVFGVHRDTLADIDEFGVEIQRMNRKFGKSYISFRVRQKGHYSRDTKFTVIIAVASTGERWMLIRQVQGTTAQLFEQFLSMDVLPGLSAIQPPRIFNLLMDNLNSHRSPRVANAIYFAGHRPMFRPPYRPHDAPIEFIINQIDNLLHQNIYNVQNNHDLFTILPTLFNQITNAAITNTFVHCGY
jgi:hypothetical protein